MYQIPSAIWILVLPPIPHLMKLKRVGDYIVPLFSLNRPRRIGPILLKYYEF
jgi:hypothetical protein